MIKSLLTYCCLFITFCLSSLFAQQQPLYSQYMFNGLAINPAYAGSHELLSLTSIYRKQWTGVEGAPSTMTFSAHTPFKNRKTAAGLVLYNDRIGVSRQTGANLSFAYRILFSKNRTLSMALQGGFLNVRSEYTQLDVRDPNDPFFSGTYTSGMLPMIGTGAYYSSSNFYIGISVPYILNHEFNSSNGISGTLLLREYMLASGYVIKVSEDVKLKPSFLLRVKEGISTTADVNLNIFLKDVISTGVSFRTSDAWLFLLQLQLTGQLSLGYSYDFLNKNITKTGSHELMLNYRFHYKNSNVKTPRYF